MLKGSSVQFFIEERTNVYSKKGREWALNCKIGDCDIWTLKTYNSKPRVKTVEKDTTLILRSFEFYHRHLEIPMFELEKENVTVRFI